MLWQEDEDFVTPSTTTQTVVDIAFNIQCRMLPVDHAWALSQAIQHALPWFNEEPQAGLHLIYVTEEGNGWYRPDEKDSLIYLSRRTKLMLRIPEHRTKDTQMLTERTLDIGSYALKVGKSTIKALHPSPVLFARHVLSQVDVSEEAFLSQAIAELANINVQCRKALCGKNRYFSTPQGELLTRSLMIADLLPQESMSLQQYGLGDAKHMGCGLFVPHKDIKAVSAKTSSTME